MVDPDRIRVWVARLAAPLAFFFAATVLVILVQRALEFDDGAAGTNGASTQSADTGPTTTEDTGPTSTGTGPCSKRRYRVRQGDTLESIAARCDISLAELLELNPNIDPLTLNPGDRIQIRPPANQ